MPSKQRSLERISGRFCAMFLTGLVASRADAIPTFGFEPGQVGWESIGDVSVQSSSLGLTPAEGSWQALITTLCDATVVDWCQTSLIEKPYSGTSSVPDAYAAQFLGMPLDQTEFRALFEHPPSHSGRGESGAIRLSFFASAGDMIAFDWNFISDGPDGDSAYFSLWSDSFRLSELLRDPVYGPFPSNDGFSLSNVDLCSRQLQAHCDFSATMETGYRTNALAIQEDGWYSLGFGLLEIQEGTVPSALAIDNIRLVRVPEPNSPWLFLVSIIGISIATRCKAWPPARYSRDCRSQRA